MTFWGRSQTFVQTLDSHFSFVRKSLRRRHEAGRHDRSARLKPQAGGEQGEVWTNTLPPFRFSPFLQSNFLLNTCCLCMFMSVYVYGMISLPRE